MVERISVTSSARKAFKATGDKEFARELALEMAVDESQWTELEKLGADVIEYYRLTSLGNPLVTYGLAVLIVVSKHAKGKMAVAQHTAEADAAKQPAAPAANAEAKA